MAEQLEQMHETNMDAVLAQLAHHYDAAGRTEEAIDYLIRAGDRARMVYALEEATAHYRRAVGHLRQRAGDARLARSLAEQFVRRHPDSPHAHRFREKMGIQ